MRGDDGGGHELGPQGGGLGGFGHPVGDVLAEQALVAGDADDLAVAERGDGAGERVAPAGQVTLVQVVQQDQADRVGDRGQGGGVAGGAQPVADLPDEPVMVGEDDVFLGRVVAEERGAAEPRPFRDVVHGGLLVAPLVEQLERGPREPVTRRRLVHGRPSSPLPGDGTTCERRSDTEYRSSDIQFHIGW